ncbi:MAG: GIY-YIG nuclease family protein [Gemmatimonadota bacterium]
MRRLATYIMANARRTVLYVGVTNDLVRRCGEHRSAGRSTFCGRYNVHRLVYYELIEGPLSAIRREKQLKAGSRAAKLDLIEWANPEWLDLCDARTGEISACPAVIARPEGLKQSG